VPVQLSLHSLAPLVLPVDLVSAPGAPATDDGAAAPPAAAATDGAPATASPATRFRIRNATQRTVTVAGVQGVALQRSPITGMVREAFPAKLADPAAPLSLVPGADTTVALRTDPADAVWNAWDVELADARPVLSDELVLSELFDAATSGVRGWQVAIDCPPLAYFDQLKPEEKAPLDGLTAVEVQVRRPASPDDVESARLTFAKPQSAVLLSRTIADFIADRATGRSTFQWRRRLLRTTRSDPWSEWQQDTGNNLSVYTA
jgi:hypothetical protein